MPVWHKRTVYVLVWLILEKTSERMDCFFVYRLRDLREDSDLKQRDLAAVLNCSQACYSRYELGNREIPMELLCQLADYYCTSVDYILGRTDEIKPYPKSRHKK